MAEGKSETDLVNGGKVEQTTCPVCLETFKNPKFLPCLHGYCADCIQRLDSKGEITCPLCRTTSSLGPDGPESLRHNYFIETLIKSTENKTCDSCEGENIAREFCFDCQQSLCTSCFKVHQSLRATRSHRVSHIDQNDDPASLRMVQKSYCRKHPNEELLFLCKCCNVGICRDCKLTKHEGHTTIDMEDCKEEASTALREKLEEFQNEINNSEKENNVNAVRQQVLECHADKGSSSIEEIRALLHGLVDRECNNLLSKIDIHLKQSKITITETEKALLSRIHSYVWKKNHVLSVLKYGTTADIIETSHMDFSEKEKRNDTDHGDKSKNGVKLNIPYVNGIDIETLDLSKKCRLSLCWKEIRVPYIQKRHSTFDVDVVMQHVISKIQVNSSMNCYILLKHVHSHMMQFQTWPNLLCYDACGQFVHKKTVSSLMDILWTDNELLMFNGYSSGKSASVMTEVEMKKVQANDKRFESMKVSYRCVCQGNSGNILLMTSKGVLSDSEGKKRMNLHAKSIPVSFTCTSNGNIFVCCPDENAVVMYDTRGTEMQRFEKEEFLPTDITHDQHDFVYVSDSVHDRVYVISIETKLTVPLIYINNPRALAIDDKRRIWIAHSGNRISVFLLA